MDEQERRRIVESGTVYLIDGLRAHFAGWKNEDNCGVHSALPGFWACSWETAKAVSERPDRRFVREDRVWQTGYGWLGYNPDADDYQTTEDYERAQAR